MSTIVVPEAKIDQNDKDNELECPYAMLCVEERIAMVEAIKVEKQRRQHARRNRPTLRSTHEGPSLPDRQLRPKANIYLRPVGPADISGFLVSPPCYNLSTARLTIVQEIYNYYVKETVHASELEEQTEAQIRIFIDGIVQSGLPCLVAVSKRNQRKGPQGYVTEKIVGFTYLTDLADTTGMYRFTFELEVYVHPGFLRQGVGKCLLDQMAHTCNTAYVKRGGYEYIAAYEYFKTGHSRTIKTILANAHYEKGDDVEWATNYMGDFGFKRAGRLSQIGHKAGKVVDKVMFQMHTSEVVDPHSIPAVPF